MARTKGSDDLFKLIHSLTAEEKGYFKKFAKRHTPQGNQYLQLFDAINKQPVFEEASLKKKFKGFAMMKIYLFDTIVHSLIMSGSGFSVTERLLMNALQIHLLRRKGMPQRALSLLKIYTPEAEETDNYALLSLLLKLKLDLFYFTLVKPGEIIEATRTGRLEIIEAEQKMRNIEEKAYQVRIGTALYLMRKNQGIVIEPSKEMDLQMLESKELVLTEYEEMTRLRALAMYYVLQKDLKKVREKFNEINTYERERYQLARKKFGSQASPRYYLKSLGNCIQAAISDGRLKEAKKFLDELKALKMANDIGKDEKIFIHAYFTLQVLWFGGQHSEGEKLTAEQEKLMSVKYFSRFWQYVMGLVASKALFELSNRHFAKALNTLNFFNSVSTDKYSSRHRKASELLKILIQLELSNDELIPSMVRSVQRRIKNLTPPEIQFLEILKAHKGSRKQLWYKLGVSPAAQLILFDFFGVRDWIQSKISGDDLATVISKAEPPGIDAL